MTDLRKTLTLDKTQVAMIKAFGNQELTDYCIVQVAWFYIYYRDKSILESKYKILWSEPQWHDVFRVAKEKWWYKCQFLEAKSTDIPTILEIIVSAVQWKMFNIDITKSPLEQPEVMEQLLSLIK